MGLWAVELDPTSEDATNTPLAFASPTYRLLEIRAPVPTFEHQWASNVDTEGERSAGSRPGNREIGLKLQIRSATDAAFRTAQRNLDMKIGKLRREGGTLKLTHPNADTIVFDVLAVNGGDTLFDDVLYRRHRIAQDELTFVCLPFGRGPVQTFTATQETSLPVHRFLAASVKGDVPALGKLTVTDVTGADQFWFHWGERQRHYSNDADNALFYEAEGRTPLGGAAVATGSGGLAISGGGSNNTVLQGTLTPGWQAMLSTQATGGGAHLEHIGIYEFWARVALTGGNTGEVSVRLDWGQGAAFARPTSNPEITFEVDDPREGKYFLVNLGQVFLQKVAQGTQRWEGRIVAKSTVTGDDFWVDCFWLRPMEEGNGTARALLTFDTPTSFLARSEFDTESGVITGDSAAVGGVWAGAGDADDFSAAAGVATRTAVSDAAAETGRYALSGVAAFAAQAVQADIMLGTTALTGSGSAYSGVLARYVDTNNWIFAGLFWGNAIGWVLAVRPRLAGVASALLLQPFTPTAATWYTVRLTVLADGRWRFWFGPRGATPPLIASGQLTDAATGGALDDGKPGIYDAQTVATASTRSYDNFQAFAPTFDAAVFASQSLEIRHDRAIREDAAGTGWDTVSDYSGDYLLVPPAGMEGRTSEILVKASRDDPDWGPDLGIDDITVDLEVIPRFLKIPEP